MIYRVPSTSLLLGILFQFDRKPPSKSRATIARKPAKLYRTFVPVLVTFSKIQLDIYTWIFENGTARSSGNIKIMSARRLFFFSPLSPRVSFLSRVVSRLFGVIKPRFRCHSGDNGQLYIYIYTNLKIESKTISKTITIFKFVFSSAYSWVDHS